MGLFRYFIVFVLASILLSRTSCANQEKWEALDTFITTQLKEYKAPGCIVAVVGPNKVYFLKAYGVKKLGKPQRITSQTLFQLGSVSKPITSTLVVKLHGQNKLHLEEPLSTYLSDFQLKDQSAPLTLKHLLSHTSGVPRYGFNALIETHPERAELLRMVQTVEVTALPGENFDYHNVMFALTEDVIKTTCNQSFETLLKEKLFKPLKMVNACSGLECLEQSHDRAVPHVKNKKGEFVPLESYSKAYYAVTPAGGINASMDDLIPFLKAQLGGYPNVLSARARSILHFPQITEDLSEEKRKEKSVHLEKAGYALGWRWMDYAGERVIYHGGWLKGFNTLIAFIPAQEIGIIVLHNAETSLPWKTTVAFLDLCLSVSQRE